MRGCSGQLLAELLTKTLTDEESSELAQVVAFEEVKAAMFRIDGEKAPGPDGYTAHFYRSCWSIVGQDVVDTVLHFFSTMDLLPAFNSTIVSLVPKSKNHNSIRDFRPISCCTMVYKCITKVLANKIKKVLPGVIRKN